MKELHTLNSNVFSNAQFSPDQTKVNEGVDTLRAAEEVSKSDTSTSRAHSSQEDLFEEVKQNLSKLNEFLPMTETNLSFEFDENGDPPFIRVLDKDNDKVIREIPSEEFREVAKALDEFADKLQGKGMLFDKTA